jgi:hypothetical protein
MFMKLGMYNMTVFVSVHPCTFAKQRLGKNIIAATKEELLESFAIRSVLFERKLADNSCQEIVAILLCL